MSNGINLNSRGKNVLQKVFINDVNNGNVVIWGANKESYSKRFHRLEFGGSGAFTDYPFRTTVVGDFFRLDYKGEFEIARAKTYQLQGMGLKIVLYEPFSSLSERMDFYKHWNLSLEEIAPMDLNGTYYVDLPYKIGYEGRDSWRNFFIGFIKLLFDAGFNGIEFDGGDGLYRLGSFDPETMQKFNQYLASRYNSSELKEKFNITDINTFNFTQYLIDLGYNLNSIGVDGTVIAHPGPDGPSDNQYAIALWQEFLTFNTKMLVELYKMLMDNVNQWEEETGREFLVSTRVGGYPYDLHVLQYLDAVNWEYCWVDYPNRTASKDFRILQSLNKTFNPWIYPWSSLEATGFTEWFSNGWNRTMDPEEQYLALSELIVCGGRIPVNPDPEDAVMTVNKTHYWQFIRLVQENPYLFDGRQFGEIALIYPLATAINLEKLHITSMIEEGNFDDYEGTYYLLADSHRTFDVIVFGDNIFVNLTTPVSALSRYKAIVLPNAICLTDDQVDLLEQYVQSGGIIIGIGDIATYNEYGEPVNRPFSSYFDGSIHQVGNGLIVSIKDISPSQYLALRTYHNPFASNILNSFKDRINQYVPPETWSETLPEYAHIYRFYNSEENSLIFDIINFNYDFERDKVVRAYNVDFSFKLPESLKDKELSIWIYSEDYPEGFEVSYELNGDNVSITIPKLSILTVVEVRQKFQYKEPLIVNKPKTFNGVTVNLDRSLIIKSRVIFYNSEIIIKGGVKPIKIEVLPGGSLIIMNSEIRRETGSYYIVARDGSHLVVQNSIISNAGLFGPLDRGGLCIETEGAVILNNLIYSNYDYGILLVNADHSIIGNNVIYNNNVGVAIVNSSYIDFFNNTVINNNLGVCIETPDINDVGVRLRKLIRMWEHHKIPSRGAVKITISGCYIAENKYTNVAVSECNFVTIRDSFIGETEGSNIFFWESSTVKIFNCTINSARYGIYLEESPVNTILGNEIYNHSFAGILTYKCIYQGVLYWNHLENPEGETRIIGNHIKNNTYGIYMDFGWGYFNGEFRIHKNEISYNTIGVYVNLTHATIYENNFINNVKHAEVGPGGGQGFRSPGIFYLNISQTLYGFPDPPVGNYWDDWDKQTIPYEVCPGWYDYFPLDQKVNIPVITDGEGPLITIEDYQREWVNDTHYKILINYLATDTSLLGGGASKDTLFLFGCYMFVGPYLRQLDPPYYELEFPWLGYPGPPMGELLGPETTTNTFRGTIESSIINASWLKDATLNIYISDMWGNWNKNDSAPPKIFYIYSEPFWNYNDNEITIYALISDWSPISKAQLIYLNESTWITVNMNYDEKTHLYYTTIPLVTYGDILYFKISAEDIYGNRFTSGEYNLDLLGPRIISITWEPKEPTNKDPVLIKVNVTDPSGISSVILSYSTGESTWYNITMTYNDTLKLYEAVIPAMPSNTTVYYAIYANDSYSNWAKSEIYSYMVKESGKPGTNLMLYIGTTVLLLTTIVAIIVYIKKKH